MKTIYLTAREEHQLLLAACNGDLEARNKVITNAYSLVRSIVNKSCARSLHEREDATQFVFTKLCEKFYKFEANRGVRYMTYAQFWVRQALQEYWRTKGFFPPLKGKRIQVQSIDSKEGSGPVILKMLRDGNETPEVQVQVEDQIEKLDQVLALLDSRERSIVTRRSKGDKLQSIADTLGLSRERVRQIERSALMKMRIEFER